MTDCGVISGLEVQDTSSAAALLQSVEQQQARAAALVRSPPAAAGGALGGSPLSLGGTSGGLKPPSPLLVGAAAGGIKPPSPNPFLVNKPPSPLQTAGLSPLQLGGGRGRGVSPLSLQQHAGAAPTFGVQPPV